MKEIRNIIALVVLALLALLLIAYNGIAWVLSSWFVPQSASEAWGVTKRFLQKVSSLAERK